MHPRFVVALAGLGALDLGYIDFVVGPQVLATKPAAVHRRMQPIAPQREAAPTPAPAGALPAPETGTANGSSPSSGGAERRGPPGETWWIVNFPEAGQVTLSEAAEQQLAQIAARFASSHDVRINIVGHADERGENDLNDRLGSLRAQAVAQALQRAGFAARQVQIGSRGEGAPAVLGEGPDAWAANRRAELEVVTVAKSKSIGEAAQ
jgi:outer membrane protein OmpA-like peptidoglycan-associated protein